MKTETTFFTIDLEDHVEARIIEAPVFAEVVIPEDFDI